MLGTLIWLKTRKIVKFVPASGAASRMFKNLYEFLSADYKEPMNAFEKKFFSEIEKFAFYKALDKKCVENTGKDIPALVALGEYKEDGTNYWSRKAEFTDSYRKACCFSINMPIRFVRRWKNIWPKAPCTPRITPAR